MSKESLKRLTVLPLDDPNAVKITYKIVPPERSDPAKGRLNLNSPLVVAAAKVSPGTDFEVGIIEKNIITRRLKYRLISKE